MSSFSNPGLGYIITPLPQKAVFTPLGRYFTISYLPEDIVLSNKLELCVWLGPGKTIIPLRI